VLFQISTRIGGTEDFCELDLCRCSYPGLRDAVCPANPIQTAAAMNHRSWYMNVARADLGMWRVENETLWTVWGRGDVASDILFPPTADHRVANLVDSVLQECRRVKGLRRVSCWSIEAAGTSELAIILLARGFRPSARPNWMGLRIGPTLSEPPMPNEIDVRSVDGHLDWDDVIDLPYYSASVTTRIERLTTASPREVWYLAATLGGQPVGLAALHRTEDRPTVAGLYDCGVVPSARRSGVGSALVHAGYHLARELDASLMVLNATRSGLSLYEHLGFKSAGRGQIWRLSEEILINPPKPSVVEFCEAIGHGDVGQVGELATKLKLDLCAPLACGLTPIELAAVFERSTSAERLEERGATVDLISAWDFGWKERADKLLVARPDSANARGGYFGATPLHIAAQRDDIELAQLILRASPDTSIRDLRCGASAATWAEHFHSNLVAQLLEPYRDGDIHQAHSIR
jgi:GNAT superfamily N-acetyltransferase